MAISMDLGNLLVHLRIPQDEVVRTLSSVEAKLNASAARMASIGAKMSLAITTPLVLMGRQAMRTAMSLEDAFAGVRKTVDATEQQFAELKMGFDAMARRMPIGVTELYSIGEAAGQLGIQRERILDFTKTMAALGVTTNMTSQQAASDLARLANIMQMPQTNFDKLGSTIVALGNNLATTEAEIVSMGLRMAGVGKVVGLTEAEVMSLAASLSSVGMEAEAGGTAISKIFLDMYNAAMSGGDSLRVFAAVAGQTTQEFAAAFKQNAAEGIITFIEGLGQLHREGYNVSKVLELLGMDNVRVTRALLSAASAGDLFRQSLKLGSDAWRDNNALVEEANKRYATQTSRMRILRNNLVLGAEQVGNILAGYLLKIGEVYLKPTIRVFESLNETTKKHIVQVGLVAASLGPLILGIAGVEKMLAILAGTLAKLAHPIVILTGLFGGWLLAAAAVGAIAYTLYAAWNQNLAAVKDRMQDLLNSFKVGFEWLLDTPLGQLFMGMVRGFIETYEIIKRYSWGFLSDIAGAIAGTVAWIKKMKESVTSAWEAPTFHQFIQEFKLGWKDAGDAWAETFEEGKNKTDKALTELAVATKNTLKEVKDVWLPAFGEVSVEHWGTLLDAVKTQFSNDVRGIMDVLVKTFPELQKLINVVSPLQESPWDAFFDKIINKAKEAYTAVSSFFAVSGGEAATGRSAGMDALFLAPPMSEEAIRSAWDKLYSGLDQRAKQYFQYQQNRLNAEVKLWQDNADAIALQFKTEKSHVLDLIEAYKNEQQILLEIDELKASERIVDGFKAAGIQIRREIQTWGERAYDFVTGMVNTLENGLMNMVRDMRNWTDAMKGMLKEIYYEAIRIAFVRPFAEGLAGAFSAAGSAMAGGFTGGGAPKYPTGGHISLPEGFAGGGIAWTPQLAHVAENEPELITPFSKLGSLGGDVTVNIINESGVPLSVSRQSEYMVSDRRILDVVVSAAQSNPKFRHEISQVRR